MRGYAKVFESSVRRVQSVKCNVHPGCTLSHRDGAACVSIDRRLSLIHCGIIDSRCSCVTDNRMAAFVAIQTCSQFLLNSTRIRKLYRSQFDWIPNGRGIETVSMTRELHRKRDKTPLYKATGKQIRKRKRDKKRKTRKPDEIVTCIGCAVT